MRIENYHTHTRTSSKRQEWTYSTDEELGAIGVGARVGHGENAFAHMRQIKVLVVEAIPVNRFPSGTVVVRKVSLFLVHDEREGGRMSAQKYGNRPLFRVAVARSKCSCRLTP